MMRNQLTAEQTAARLGVQLKTIYAYVSRGVLERSVADDGRTSLFDPRQVEALARRGRPRAGSRPMGGVDVSLTTAITSIESDRLAYRGHDVRTLVETPFEAVAELLWTGALPERTDWSQVTALAPRTLGLDLPASSPAIERFAAVTAALACNQPLRVDLRSAAVTAHARLLLRTLATCLPKRGSAGTRHGGIAACLWPRVCELPPTTARVSSLNTALVLLADHELATSTFAARVAASTRADPFAVVLAGLGAVSGPLHGKAALAAHELLLRARDSSPEAAVARALSVSGKAPGFHHPVYRGADPRAQCLEPSISALASKREYALIDAVRAAVTATAETYPNVDFALAAYAFALRMPLGATEAIFALARIAGWIAHALEEYGEAPLRFRARALYVGNAAD